MSKILRRPMFRGGPVDSRGTGITSGLMDGGRVGYKTGGEILRNVNTRFDPFFQNMNMDQLRAFQSLGMGNPFRAEKDMPGRFANIFNLRPAEPSKSIVKKVIDAAPIVQEQKAFEEETDKIGKILDNKKFFSGNIDEVKEQMKGTDAENIGELQTTDTTVGNTTQEPAIDAKSLIKENAELFKELFAEANKEKIKRARIQDLSDIGLDVFAKSQQEGATVGSTLAGAAERLVGKKSRVEEAKDAIDKQGDTSIALAINDYISGKRNKEQMDRMIAGKDLDLARAITLADYKKKKEGFIDNLKENVKGMNFSTALITTVQETFGKPPAKIFTKKDIDKGAKVDLVEENVGEYFVYPSGKVTTIQEQSDGSFAEVIVYTRGG